jgi:primosomal protein N' (replication factor Y)
LLRAEHFEASRPGRFLEEARALLENHARGVQIFGPVPAPMERKAGCYRFQLLLQAGSRAELGKALRPWVRALEELPAGRRVRWSLDVDPQDML